MDVFFEKGLCEMQIMFTCLMPLWSAGGRQSERGTILSQASSDPLLTKGSTKPFGQLSLLQSQASNGAYVQALPWQILNPSVGER